MDRLILESFLPAFMIVFCGIVFLWDYSQGKNKDKLLIARTGIYKEIHFVKKIFKLLFSASIVVTVVYAFFPEYYTIFVPIDFLDHPIINTIGVLILKISLAWIVIALLFFNKSVFMTQVKNNEAIYSQLILYASRHLL